MISRCESCKFYSEDDDCVGHCELGICDGSDTTNYQVSDMDVVEPDFGCIKYKEKEND